MEHRFEVDERRKHLRMMLERHVAASRRERSRPLEAMEAVTEQHRRSPMRSMSNS